MENAMRVNSTRIWKNIQSYPEISAKIRAVRFDSPYPEEIRDFLDRALWSYLYEINLKKEFTLDEALIFVGWLGQNPKTSHIPIFLQNKIKADLGIAI